MQYVLYDALLYVFNIMVATGNVSSFGTYVLYCTVSTTGRRCTPHSIPDVHRPRLRLFEALGSGAYGGIFVATQTLLWSMNARVWSLLALEPNIRRIIRFCGNDKSNRQAGEEIKTRLRSKGRVLVRAATASQAKLPPSSPRNLQDGTSRQNARKQILEVYDQNSSEL